MNRQQINKESKKFNDMRTTKETKTFKKNKVRKLSFPKTTTQQTAHKQTSPHTYTYKTHVNP